MTESQHDSWRDKRIEQLSFTINLLLSLAFGALALLLDNWQQWSSRGACLLLLSAGLLFAAGLLGLGASITRLLDFRYTARRENPKYELDRAVLDTLTDILGRTTWLLFWLQVGLFVFGVFALTVAALRSLI